MGEITQLLEQANTDKNGAASELFARVYGELRQLAGTCLRAERSDHTLQATALVNEAFLRLAGGEPIDWQSRAHFFGIAGRVMRRILVEHARARNTGKRGGAAAHLPLEDSIACAAADPVRLIEIDDALTRLGQADARAVQVVELRFFGGLNVEESAAALGVSTKTVTRDWEFARAWLEHELQQSRPL